MKKKTRIHIGNLGILLLIVLAIPATVLAQSSSPNYKVEESFFGTGGQVDSSSPNYRAYQSTGALGVGSASSNNYDAVAGFNTPVAPFLEVYVTDASVNFGVLEPSAPSYGAAQGGDCNCSFSVRSYLSSDYAVISAGQPPTNEVGNSLSAKSVTGPATNDTSVEEFGINVVANTSPVLGADPKNQPDDTFADGQANSGYDVPNNFKYSIGDIIAKSPAINGNPGIGKTDYTISYMAKIRNITPSGNYVMKHDIIVVPSF